MSVASFSAVKHALHFSTIKYNRIVIKVLHYFMKYKYFITVHSNSNICTFYPLHFHSRLIYLGLRYLKGVSYFLSLQAFKILNPTSVSTTSAHKEIKNGPKLENRYRIDSLILRKKGVEVGCNDPHLHFVEQGFIGCGCSTSARS